MKRIHQLFFCNIHNTVLMKLHAVIIHQDVEPSKGFDRCLHNVAASVFLPQIRSYRHTVSSKLVNDSLRFGRILVLVEIRDHQIGSFLGKSDGHGPPDSTIPARHNRYFFFSTFRFPYNPDYRKAAGDSSNIQIPDVCSDAAEEKRPEHLCIAAPNLDKDTWDTPLSILLSNCISITYCIFGRNQKC